MSRYDDRFKGFSGIGNVAGPSQGERQARQRASGNADWLRMLAGIAPAAGSLIGGGIGTAVAPGVGTGIGAALGGAAGQLGGGLLSGAADQQTKGFDDREAERSAKLNALMSVLGGRR